MKSTVTALCGCIAILSLSACGSSGSTAATPATPTSVSTQAASATAVDTTQTVANDAAAYGIQNMKPSASISKTAVPYSDNITMTCPSSHCQSVCANGGSASVTGPMSASVTGNPDVSWTASNITGSFTIVFTDCVVTATIGTTTYNEVMNGTVTSALTGSAAGNGQTFTSLSFSGTLAGTPTLTGDVAGTVNLANTTYSGTGTSSPTITCAGTSDVTISGTSQVCTVATTCDGCTE